MSERILLSLFTPKPIPADVEIMIGERTHRKKIQIIPLTLGDEQRWVEDFGDDNPLREAFEKGDYSILVDAVVRQIDPNDRKWMMAVFGVDNEDDLKEGILASQYQHPLVHGLITALTEMRGGEVANDEVKKKTAGYPPLMKWAFTSCGILVGALLTSGILLLDSWLPFIVNLLFKT